MRAVLRWAAIGAGLVLVVTAGLGLAAYRKFSGNIHTDRATERALAAADGAGERPRSLVPRARNILVLGALRPGDGFRADPAARTGGADAAVLLHLSADRGRAAAVGVPGGLMVGVPSCPRPDGGGASPAAYEPFGAAFAGGGAACAIRAFERLSGIRVDHHMVVDVPGFAKIVTAVGGTRGRGTVETPATAADSSAGGSPQATAAPAVPAVPTEAAAAGRRRDLLGALTREARGGSLTHPARLFGVLDAATSSLTADRGLGSLPALYELAGRLRKVPPDGLVFTAVPADAGGARRLFADLRADRPLAGRPPARRPPVPQTAPWQAARVPGRAPEGPAPKAARAPAAPLPTSSHPEMRVTRRAKLSH